jgi:hypothetical protein
VWVLADSAYNNIAIREYLRAGLEGVLYPKGFVRKGVHKINQWCGAYIVWYVGVE